MGGREGVKEKKEKQKLQASILYQTMAHAVISSLKRWDKDHFLVQLMRKRRCSGQLYLEIYMKYPLALYQVPNSR